MLGLDLYLEKLSHEDYDEVREEFQNVSSYPLLSMDFFTGNFHKQVESLRKQQDLKSLYKFHEEFKKLINRELILREPYDALVLTDANQVIKWVNKGFSNMTGYSAAYAVGKTPKFLQGEATNFESRERIRKNLGKPEIFTETVINYRKSREIYKCQLTIIPLLSKTPDSTHFLAIEKEVA